MTSEIIIKGARQHNLQNVSLSLPRDKLIVFTGLSGSGKSSLAFDTIFAEGQRRYVESLSAYARQFLGQLDKPDVDSVEGLSPAISIDQKGGSRNPRSTVGTVTEIYDYLRVLFARAGRQYCPDCKVEVDRQSPEQIVARIMDLPDGTKFYVLAPIVKGRKGHYKGLLTDIVKRGYARAKVDGKIMELSGTSENSELARYEQHTIEVVVDRLVKKASIKERLTQSIENALALAGGIAEIEILSGDESDIIGFSQHFSCNNCGRSFEELAPRNFSFNSPYGACPECNGLGYRLEADPEAIVQNDTLSLRQGALRWYNSEYAELISNRELRILEKYYKINLDVPFHRLSDVERKLIFLGEKSLSEAELKSLKLKKADICFRGISEFLEAKYNQAHSDGMRSYIGQMLRESPCRACGGQRLKEESRAVRVDAFTLCELCDLPVDLILERLKHLKLTGKQQKIAEPLIREITNRLEFLLNVGLGYLTLSRSAKSLAGGESQRIRLASQIGSGLAGVLYVLDEPSIGLHPRDNSRLLSTLRHLRDLGNTVLVVEHDQETIENADFVVEIGPGAGVEGGRIVYQGSVSGLIKSKHSLTGKYLRGDEQIVVPSRRRAPDGRYIEVKQASANNLKNIDVAFPLGMFIAITGVSGSGKSTLVNQVMLEALKKLVNNQRGNPLAHGAIHGYEYIDKVISVDQSPIGRTPRSNPATYVGAFTPIRELFAETVEAKIRGYKPGRFSFNVKGGRCETCSGDGTVKIEMHFLSDVYVICESCKGKRYNEATLEVTFRGLNISDVLNMSVQEGLEFFSKQPKIIKYLQTLNDVGLGYIKLGQSATTLSGGEAQRIKLASELSKRPTGRTLYVLDEPTTGLHFHDIRKLIAVLQRLVDSGNTVIVIEHNLDLVKCADWVIDLGPEGGDNGGQIIFAGTPEDLCREGTSYTAKYLKRQIYGEE